VLRKSKKEHPKKVKKWGLFYYLKLAQKVFENRKPSWQKLKGNKKIKIRRKEYFCIKNASKKCYENCI